MTILAAVDDADRSPIVQRGYELARAFGEDLLVLNVQPRTGDGPTDDAEHEAEAEAIAAEAIELTLEDPVAVTTAGAVGDPASRILGACTEHDVSYVVLRPRERTPIRKALMGSVSQLVLQNADCTVVFVTDESEA